MTVLCCNKIRAFVLSVTSNASLIVMNTAKSLEIKVILTQDIQVLVLLPEADEVQEPR